MRGNFKNIEHCRICGSTELSVAMTLPPQFLSPTFVETNIGNELSDIKVAMTMLVCGNSECAFVQLKETTKPELLYTDYFYRTATNDTMKKDLKYVVDTTLERCPLNKGDIIVDIGANDCTMVRWFPENVRRIAIEPAKNIDWHHIPDEIEIVNDFFPSTAAADKLNGHKIKIFTSCAMFYDVDDPNAFVRAVKFYLHADGIWCLQVSYNLLMIKNANFYDICHEHLGFYTLKSLGYLFSRHGLKIHHAETRSVNGGSILVFVKHESAIDGQSGNVKDLLTEEKEMGLYEVGTYIDLYKKMEALRSNVTEYITNEITNKRLVLGLGASTKGNVLLQFFGLDKNMIPAISERQASKVGLKTLGTDIELISEEHARSLNPSCMLVLPWYFKEEIVQRERQYLEQGGKLLFPMPYPHIVTAHGEVEI